MKASMFHVMRKTKSEQVTYSLLHPTITGLAMPRFSPLYMTVVGKFCHGILIAPQVQMRVFGSCILSFAWVALGRVIVEEG